MTEGAELEEADNHTTSIGGQSGYEEYFVHDTRFSQANLIGSGQIDSFRNTLKANFRGVVNSLRNPPTALTAGAGTTVEPEDLLLSARIAPINVAFSNR